MEKHFKIDELTCLVPEYRSVDLLQRFVNYFSRYTGTAVYNVALMALQNPDARMLLPAEKWKQDYNRWLVHNASGVISLSIGNLPFTLLFDIDNTVLENGNDEADKTRILHDFESKMNEIQTIQPEWLENIYKNLKVHCIELDRSDENREIKSRNVKVSDDALLFNTLFEISVDRRKSEFEQFQFLIPQLAHFFCLHLPDYYLLESRIKDFYEWEDYQGGNFAEQEEALVLHVLFHHLHLDTSSLVPLSCLADSKGFFSCNVSLGFVIDAVKRIELMMKPHLSQTKSLLNVRNKTKKSLLKDYLNSQKEEDSQKDTKGQWSDLFEMDLPF